VLDEAAAIGGLASPRTQPHLERGERTDDAQPGLRDDDADGCHVSGSKPPVVHPAPSLQVADDDQREPCDDKCRNAHVGDQHDVREQAAERWSEHRGLPFARRGAKGAGGPLQPPGDAPPGGRASSHPRARSYRTNPPIT